MYISLGEPQGLGVACQVACNCNLLTLLLAATLPAHLRDCDGGMEVAALIPIYNAILHPNQTTEQHAFNLKSVYWQSFRHVLQPLLADEDLHHGFRYEHM